MSKAGRLVLIQILGECCKNCGDNENMVIHHVDGNHDNNVISNLELLCNSCHSTLHNTGITHIKRSLLDPIPHDGILEYLSRPARRKITKALCQKLVINHEQPFKKKILRRKRGRPNYIGMSLLADKLGISRKTISRWVYQDMQGSNENVRIMLTIARDLIPQELSRILIEDLSEHRTKIHTFLDS